MEIFSYFFCDRYWFIPEFFFLSFSWRTKKTTCVSEDKVKVESYSYKSPAGRKVTGRHLCIGRVDVCFMIEKRRGLELASDSEVIIVYSVMEIKYYIIKKEKFKKFALFINNSVKRHNERHLNFYGIDQMFKSKIYIYLYNINVLFGIVKSFYRKNLHTPNIYRKKYLS